MVYLREHTQYHLKFTNKNKGTYAPLFIFIIFIRPFLEICIIFDPKTMQITYKTDVMPETTAIIAVYESAGLNRPTKDKSRIAEMYANSNLIVTAWDKEKLVGIARALTDFCYSCYLSDLAVRKEYQKQGIGKELISVTKGIIGERTMLLLLSASTAMEYYPKVGFEKVKNGFVIRRTI